MTDIIGKTLSKKHYQLLKDLGIEIVMYDLKVIEDHTTSGLHQSINGKVSYGFELYGSIRQDVNFDELYDLLLLLKQIKNSENPAIKDILEQLKIIIEISE